MVGLDEASRACNGTVVERMRLCVDVCFGGVEGVVGRDIAGLGVEVNGNDCEEMLMDIVVQEVFAFKN